MKTKILITRAMLEKDITYLKKGLDKEVENMYELILPINFHEDTLCSSIDDVEIILGPYVTEKMIRKGRMLRLIQVPWTGIENMNIEVIKNSKIILCNSHSNSDSVAEVGIAITLDLLKKITYHHNKLSSGNWNRDNEPLNLQSRMLKNENIIILGCGHIGSKIAKLYKSFGANVLGFHEKENCCINGLEIYNMKYLDEKLDNASIIVSTMPLFSSTRKTINENMISRLNNKCIIINLSRAEIVDEKTIYNALISAQIAGYGSDVWWNTPNRGETIGHVSKKYDFSKFPNVIMSPHRAGFVEDSLPHLDDAIKNIINYINKVQLINVINF